MVIKMYFYKYEGIGNDFIITEDKNIKDIVRLCDRHFGIGADGVIVIENISDIVRIRIYNADGSEAKTCGNGLRCIGAYLKHKLNKNEFKIQTIWDLYNVRVIDEEYEVTFPLVKDIKRENDYYIVNSGNNHIITINNKDFDKFIFDINKKYDANIENVIIKDRNNIEIKVYERGVGFTLACGSGAIATVSALYKENLINNDVVCKMDGGYLKVVIKEDKACLIGKANLVYKGEY